MVAATCAIRGAVRTVSYALLLLLYFDPATSQLRPDYSDLPGKYCETRPKDSESSSTNTVLTLAVQRSSWFAGYFRC